MTDLFYNKYRIKSARCCNWDYGWNGIYFITICTADRTCFFGKIVNKEMVLSAAGRIVATFWSEIPNHFTFINLDEFVIMPNHIHGLLVLSHPNVTPPAAANTGDGITTGIAGGSPSVETLPPITFPKQPSVQHGFATPVKTIFHPSLVHSNLFAQKQFINKTLKSILHGSHVFMTMLYEMIWNFNGFSNTLSTTQNCGIRINSLIMSEWKKYKLKNIAAKIGSGATPKGGSNSYIQEGISLIRSQNVLDLGFSTGGLVFLDIAQANGLKNVIVVENDILLNITGDSVARICKVPQKVLPARVNQHVAIIRTLKRFDPDFLLYKLFSMKEYLLSLSEIGATRRALTKRTLEELAVDIPEYSTQITIASVLSCLDDKIDLLHRQNKTLEQLAETLFRQWFVEEADAGWDEKGLDEIAEFLNGLACQKYPVRLGETGLPVIKIKELRNGITESSDVATNNVPEKYIVRDGDMLFSWSGSLDIIIWSGSHGVLNQHLFKVTSFDYPQWFYYFWIKHHLPEFQGIAEDKATTMGHIQRHHLSNAMVLVPPKKTIDAMDEAISPIFEKSKNNQTQIRTLTQLRDTLLPKLISGEVRVKDF